MSSPVTVYLDLNKWIDLSRAHYGKREGEKFIETLALVRNAVDKGVARFPISAEHVIEAIKYGNAHGRKRLVHFMVEISRGLTIASKENITHLELEIALARIFKKMVPLFPPTVLGLGMSFIWGAPELGLLENGLPLMMRSVGEEVVAKLDIRANLVKGAMMSLISIFEQEDEVRRKEITQRYCRYIKDTVGELEKLRKIHKRFGRDVRYLHYATSQIDNLQDSFHISLTKMGLTEDDFLALGKKGIKALYEAIPTLNVMTELAMERDSSYNKAIAENDATDISFLSVAIPYCDVVVTEKFWVSIIEKKKLSTKYNTIVLKDLCDLDKIPIHF